MAAKVQLTTADDVANASTTANAKLDNAEKMLKNIKIEVNAWGLNGVNNSSYYMKKIKPEWSYDWWNPNTESTKYYRSYWAEDPNYNDGSYPKNAANHNETDDEDNQKVWSLNYFSTSEIMEAYSEGKPQYCLENTLGETILSNYMTHATHVILLATMKVDDSAIDLFNYKGVLYDLDNYKKVALSDFTASKSIYKKTTENENTVYTQISIEDIEINSLMDGKVNIKVKDTNVQADTWYKGNTNEATAYTVDELNELFKDLNDAEGYKGGKMYYVIPIEHLASETVDKESLKVGDYGVVRNHYYTITVKSISNLGKGIYDPDEVIVPNFDPEKYYVAAQLNVLSWKTVQQEVEL